MTSVKAVNSKRRHPVRRVMKRITTIMLVLLAAWVIHTFIAAGIIPVNTLDFLNRHKTANTEYGWNLILVNQSNYIPSNYTKELTELWNGECVDSRIYPSLQEMFDAAKADGVYMVVRSGYRSNETQQRFLDEKIQEYQNEGYSKSKAKKAAEQWVAVPGTSEHQLGIAVDINQDISRSTSDDVYNWLANNAYKFGFIQRYPSDKADITGIIYEPWHYRYVGTGAAQEIYEQGMCLEEYIMQMK